MSSEVVLRQNSYIANIFDIIDKAIAFDSKIVEIKNDIFYECAYGDSDRREELIHDMQELFNEIN